jgi:hypothetical protein
MTTNNTNTSNKSTGEKVFFGILFGLIGSYIAFVISTMFIPYEKYQALLDLIF